MEWFRTQTNIVLSDKLMTLPRELLGLQLILWAIAYGNEAVLPPLKKVAFIARMDEKELEKSFEILKEARLWDQDENGEWVPHDWELYQGEKHSLKSNRERQKEYRERKRKERETLQRVTTRYNAESRNVTLQRVTNDENLIQEDKNPESVTGVTTRYNVTLQTDRQTDITSVTQPEKVRVHEPPVDPDVEGWRVAEAISKVAENCVVRHRKDRCASRVEIERKLAQLVGNIPDPIKALKTINRNHREACDSDDWQREAGRYVPGILKWLESPAATTATAPVEVLANPYPEPEPEVRGPQPMPHVMAFVTKNGAEVSVEPPPRENRDQRDTERDTEREDELVRQALATPLADEEQDSGKPEPKPASRKNLF